MTCDENMNAILIVKQIKDTLCTITKMLILQVIVTVLHINNSKLPGFTSYIYVRQILKIVNVRND